MSLINMFLSAKAAIANWRDRRRAYDELMALDDRSLADIGLHRSQIPALVEGAFEARRPQRDARHAELPAALGAPVLGPSLGRRLLPKA